MHSIDVICTLMIYYIYVCIYYEIYIYILYVYKQYVCMHVMCFLFCKALQSHALVEPAKKSNRMDADDWKSGT